MPPADNMPDFDSMTPEEVMAWMESLAKRQGATEGFTTSADMNIAEIDPSAVQIDEPGYVPFGQEAPKKPAAAPAGKPSASAPSPTSKPAAEPKPSVSAPARPTPAAPPAVAKAPPTPPPSRTQSAKPAAAVPPAASRPAASAPPARQTNEPEVPQPAPAVEPSGMAWLESLAANQESEFQLDLSALSAEVEPLPLQVETPTNPLDWLASLSESEAETSEPSTPTAATEADEPDEVVDPFAAGVDPMLWLESLARRQGARSEELTTNADMNVPTPKNAVISGPGYTEFSIESDTPKIGPAKLDPAAATDPNAWLQSLSGGESFETSAEIADEKMSDDEIQEALTSGAQIPSEQMAAFFERQMDRALSRDDIPEIDVGEYDPDAPAVPADLPDWLLEQVQPPSAPQPPALREDIVEPPAVPDLPDWLKEDVEAQAAPDLDSIFETAQDIPSTPTVEPVAIDPSDPWVVAFNEEENRADSDEMPDWYERNINDPERIAAVERKARGEDESALDETPLEEETQLPAGELQAVPDWLGEPGAEPTVMPNWLASEMEESSSEPIADVAADLPDWLREAEVAVSPTDIPDWLVETAETREVEPVLSIAAPPVTPAVIVPATPPPASGSISPAPVPVSASVDVDTTLQNARDRFTNGDLNGCLLAYESIIRANTALDLVVSDMTQIADQHKDNPSVYRVLGDGLMRQGKLQAALDTYRKALNQL